MRSFWCGATRAKHATAVDRGRPVLHPMCFQARLPVTTWSLRISEAEIAGNRQRGRGMIACDHANAHARMAAGIDRLSNAGPSGSIMPMKPRNRRFSGAAGSWSDQGCRRPILRRSPARAGRRRPFPQRLRRRDRVRPGLHIEGTRSGAPLTNTRVAPVDPVICRGEPAFGLKWNAVDLGPRVQQVLSAASTSSLVRHGEQAQRRSDRLARPRLRHVRGGPPHCKVRRRSRVT